MVHVPILRAGRPYVSKDVLALADYATGQTVAAVSQANPGLLARDLREDAWTPLQDYTVADLLERLRAAADHFMHGQLPCGETMQTPDEFVALQSATTGLPYSGETWKKSRRRFVIWRPFSVASREDWRPARSMRDSVTRTGTQSVLHRRLAVLVLFCRPIRQGCTPCGCRPWR